MTRSIIAVLFCLPGYYGLQAQNLVPNPSFENYTACPTFASQLNLAAPWFNPTLGTPEYFNACVLYSDWVSVPAQPTGGFQYARTGDGYAGFYVYRTNIANMREYLETPLTEPLEAGQCYYFEMYVNQPNDHELASDGVGVYFSAGPVTANQVNPLPYTAHISNPSGNIISDTLAWTRVSGYYTAAGGEDHLTIGNFRNDANTSQISVNPGVWYTGSAYFLVDDISLTASDPEVDLGNDTTLCNSNAWLLDATTPDATYTWQSGYTGPVFQATESGTYWVTVFTGSCTVTDTIHLEFMQAPDIQLDDTLLCAGVNFLLDVTMPHTTYLWQDNSTAPVFMVTENGTYWVNVTNDCGSDGDTLEVTYQPCECHVYVPNTFTPNNDFLNDTFVPVLDCALLDSYELKIFNRWGEMVFMTRNQAVGWNGMHNNRRAPQAVYAWTLAYSAMENGQMTEKTQSGTIHLLK